MAYVGGGSGKWRTCGVGDNGDGGMCILVALSLTDLRSEDLKQRFDFAISSFLITQMRCTRTHGRTRTSRVESARRLDGNAIWNLPPCYGGGCSAVNGLLRDLFTCDTV